MTDPIVQIAVAIAGLGLVAAMAALATGLLARLLERRAILDRPNDRSSHDRPTPRGGGLVIVATVAALWGAGLWLGPALAPAQLPVLAAFAALALVSWLDDLRTLPALPRIAAQAAAVAVVMWLWPEDRLVFQGLLPAWADHALAGLGWLWFVNLFNFMDGIDGLAGSEAVAIGVGLFGLGLAGLSGDAALLGLAAAAAAAGFLWHNWPPARIFMGDVGSVPLGFLFGWLLLRAASEGLWAPALILPAYFLADATVTLLRRAARGEKVWRAHREHYYQAAVRRGLSHRRTLVPILLANAGLLALAWGATAAPLPALAAAAVLVAALLVHLAGGLRRAAG